MANGGDFVQTMADKSQKRLPKGILKTSASFEKHEKTSKKNKQKATKWDETNITETLHPADKDYGHMKIEEPKTPFAWDVMDDDEVDKPANYSVDAEELAEKLRGNMSRSPRREAYAEADTTDEELSEQELTRRNVFKTKRRMHYNEFKVVQLARKLIKADEEALEKDKNDCVPTSSKQSRDRGDETTDAESKIDEIRLRERDLSNRSTETSN